mmetsp:Transcript_2598/g.3786  ORF Transcript_2598/g.3786 Transcript_2598/m.3786 type:complete len:354 (+) Transcript_2598:128-1189(+)
MKESQASTTALLVLFAVALLWCENEDFFAEWPWSSSSPQTGLISAELVRSICKSNHVPFYLQVIPLGTLSNVYVTRIFRYICTLCLGSAPEGLWYRKFYIEDKVREFLSRQMANPRDNDDGRPHCQVLILAAGYDTLAIKLASEFPYVGFFELDHPATGNVKIETLKRMIQDACAMLGTEINPFPENLSYYHADLAKTSVKDALSMSPVVQGAKNTFQFGVPTIVVVEGLTMYLTKEQVCTMFDNINHATGVEGSCVVFNFFELDEIRRPVTPSMKKRRNLLSFSFTKNFARSAGEDLKWGINPGDLRSFFGGTNWNVVPISGGEGKGAASLLGIEYISMVNWVTKEESKKKV